MNQTYSVIGVSLGNSYVFRKEEDEFKKFIDAEITHLKAKGFLEGLFEKYMGDRELFVLHLLTK